jgi:type I restriction enzyme M protein
MSLEPRVLAGFWTNGTETAALYRTADGRFRKELTAPLPKPTDNLILSGIKLIKWSDLEPANAKSLKRCFERLLDHVVSTDAKSTRRDDQLNQLCNLLLIKLESDKRAKVTPHDPVLFQVWKDEKETYKKLSEFFFNLRLTHSDLFSSLVDRELNLDPSTVQRVCYELGTLRVLDTSMDVISAAFQVFRTASLKSEEGQYFTPLPVIKSAVRLMEISYDDKIIDPACGTGGFLVECFRQLRENHPTIDEASAKQWAQKHLYGVDKDSINIKLTKAIMMILGDGSAHTYVGDSLRAFLWPEKWPYLVSTLADESYTCIITNPPFGKNLRIDSLDAKRSNLSICQRSRGDGTFDPATYEEREIGLAFLERCYKLLVVGGRLGIVLPETYFFSSSYAWLQQWLETRLILRGMFNIPMEAFQGFCRAKTNFYVFERK